MSSMKSVFVVGWSFIAATVPYTLEAQQQPTESGQAAFAAIAEVVQILKSDPATDWSKVNIEALRQHLIDMNDVTLHSAVVQKPIPGGIEAVVTGEGRTIAAIQRMLVEHATMLDMSRDYRASATEVPAGVRLTVTARNAADSAVVARVRGLGFAGLLTEQNHHTVHHLALAKGESVHGHR